MSIFDIKRGNGELVYCATPSRLVKNNPDLIKDILNFVSKLDYAPFHPFQAFPYELFEGNPVVGRDKSMEYCKRSVRLCDHLWLFGCSNGTVEIELPEAIHEEREIKFVKDFDPDLG